MVSDRESATWMPLELNIAGKHHLMRTGTISMKETQRPTIVFCFLRTVEIIHQAMSVVLAASPGNRWPSCPRALGLALQLGHLGAQGLVFSERVLKPAPQFLVLRLFRGKAQ